MRALLVEALDTLAEDLRGRRPALMAQPLYAVVANAQAWADLYRGTNRDLETRELRAGLCRLRELADELSRAVH